MLKKKTMYAVDLPYVAEYAKTGGALCQSCKLAIDKDLLRLATRIQSTKHDGDILNWYHFECFFKRQKPKTVDDIKKFEILRIKDQKKIEEIVTNTTSIVVPDETGKGVKRDASAIKAKEEALKYYKIDYAKSGQSECRGCTQKIIKNEVRISKKDFNSETGRKVGGQDMWHHLTCFATLRSRLGYFESAEKLPGFETLSEKDQMEAINQLPAIKQEIIPAKKRKIHDEVEDEKEKKYEEQVDLMFKYRDYLKDHLNKNDYIAMLEENNQKIPRGKDAMLDCLAEIMTFGVLLPCDECKGRLVFKKKGYFCSGYITAWTKCNNIVEEPKKNEFVVPEYLKEKDDFLANYKYEAKTRIIKKTHFNIDNDILEKIEKENYQPKVERLLPPLYEMVFVILGRPKRGKEELKKQIQKLGGKVTTKINDKVMAVFASQQDVEKMGSRMSQAKNHKIHVISEEFVDEIKEYKDVPELIEKRSLCVWGDNPKKRLPPKPTTSKPKNAYTSRVPSNIKVIVKGGGAVDPKTELVECSHIYKDEHTKKIYDVTLSKTEIQIGLNSYYKLQLVKDDDNDQYSVFTRWGRIATEKEGHNFNEKMKLENAKVDFESIYEEKTGNSWGNQHFVKKPGKYYLLDIDHGCNNIENIKINNTPSSLPIPIQNLIRFIFDVNAMKRSMLEYELNTEILPLGKLSKKHLEKSYEILNELLYLVKTGAPEIKLIDATNRFYTFVPHCFDIKKPPLICDQETIKKKFEMLDSLMQIALACNLMKTPENTVDSCYKELNAKIDVVPIDSEEYLIIEEYVKNTHVEAHGFSKLEIIDVFKVKRDGEDERFESFKKLHNHKMLWHGSRTENFVSILSQGLEIDSPNKAGSSGAMFGKGIYFADIVSKSANYSSTSKENSNGLLLLCRVALGNMYEKTDGEYITHLPEGVHSIFGRGRTQPDPNYTKELDGAVVPLGKPVKVDIQSSLLYNEFIVYNVAQVKTEYLLRMNIQKKE